MLTNIRFEGNMQSFNYQPEDIFWGQLAGSLASIDAGVTTVVDHAHMTYSPDHGQCDSITFNLTGYPAAS
jgi:hypothetical protein